MFETSKRKCFNHDFYKEYFSFVLNDSKSSKWLSIGIICFKILILFGPKQC